GGQRQRIRVDLGAEEVVAGGRAGRLRAAGAVARPEVELGWRDGRAALVIAPQARAAVAGGKRAGEGQGRIADRDPDHRVGARLVPEEDAGEARGSAAPVFGER